MISHYSIQDLVSLSKLLESIPSHIYSQKLEVLSGSNIGEHTRHVLEFYGCLLLSDNSESVNYDSRKRSNELQTNQKAAVNYIEKLIDKIQVGVADRPLKLVVDFSKSGGNNEEVQSSLYRELAYCLEHSIHHKALIKIGLFNSGYGFVVEDDFGVAASTIRSKSPEVIDQSRE